MREPSRLTVWRTAAIGGFATTFAAIIDERLVVAYGTLLVFTLIGIGIVRDIGESRRRRWLNDPKTWEGLYEDEDRIVIPTDLTPPSEEVLAEWRRRGIVRDKTTEEES